MKKNEMVGETKFKAKIQAYFSSKGQQDSDSDSKGKPKIYSVDDFIKMVKEGTLPEKDADKAFRELRAVFQPPKGQTEKEFIAQIGELD